MFAASICSIGRLFSISNPIYLASRPKSYGVGGSPKLRRDRGDLYQPAPATDFPSRKHKSVELVDSGNGDSYRGPVNHTTEVFAMVHEYKMHRYWYIPGIEHSRSSAIRIDGVGPSTRPPLL